MKVHHVHETGKMAGIAAAVEADPKSWAGWSAMYIELPRMSGEAYEEACRSLESAVSSYLADVKGSSYFCRTGDICIICKNTPTPVLEQAAVHIRDLALSGRGCKDDFFRIYRLEEEGEAFADRVFQDMERPARAQDGSPQDGAARAPAREKRPVRVLLVEDDPVIRWMVRNSLKDVCDLGSADTAHKVFSTYAQFRPDITLLDIGLPDDSGKDVLDWIMRHDPSACVIMMSGRDNTENIAGCMEIGARGFIPKPFVRDDLMHYIRKYS